MNPRASADSRRERRACVWLFLVLALVYLAGTRGHLVGSDELNIYHTTRSLYENGDFAVGFTRNVAMGPDGRYYSLYNAGLAFLALPFYALAGPFRSLLEAVGLRSWVRTFSGPQLGSEPMRFGGDIEIWFTNLTNVVLTALLGVVFFRIQRLLGVRAGIAAVATLALGLATYVGPFSGGLLRHPAEALFILAAFYFAMRIGRARATERADAWWMGSMLALLIQARIAAVLALPGLLGLYLYRCVQRIAAEAEAAARVRGAVRAIMPIAVPLLGTALLYGGVNFVKFGSVFGYYGDDIGNRFETPLLYGLRAFLLSPGASIFVFSPLLLLLPWLWRATGERMRAEWVAVGAISLTYLLFYAQFSDWHGLPTAIGPRYLMAVTPLLLFPLGIWLERAGRPGRAGFASLVLLGLVVQFLHVAVSFGYVYHHEGYAHHQPPLGFMFEIANSPLVAHARALLSVPELVDTWLLTVYRQDGAGRVAILLAVIAPALALSSWKLARSVRELDRDSGEPGNRDAEPAPGVPESAESPARMSEENPVPDKRAGV